MSQQQKNQKQKIHQKIQQNETKLKKLLIAAALLILLSKDATKARLQAKLTSILLISNQQTKELALQTFLDEAGKESEASSKPEKPKPTKAEAKSAGLSAKALVDALFISIAYFISQGLARNEAVKQSVKMNLFRFNKTSATETFKIFNKSTNEAVKKSKLDYVQEWDATLDKRTCPKCRALHLKQIGSQDKWPSGLPPLHPNCRCTITYIFKQQ